jgi:ABC-type multidrug transport system ATPase subunit
VNDETTGVLEATGLYHIYREREVETVALRGAGVRLDAGTWTSVMGPSGSGKSTLIHVLGGLLQPISPRCRRQTVPPGGADASASSCNATICTHCSPPPTT